MLDGSVALWIGLPAFSSRSSSLTLPSQRTSGITYGIVSVPGFGLRVEVSGTVRFVVRYRAGGGGRSAPRRLYTIGRYGSLTVKEARTEAKAILGGVAKGTIPPVSAARGAAK